MQAYKDFSDKWASVLDQNMTDAEIAVLGKQLISYLSSVFMYSFISFFISSLVYFNFMQVVFNFYIKLNIY